MIPLCRVPKTLTLYIQCNMGKMKILNMDGQSFRRR